jgi:hypothetical protein
MFTFKNYIKENLEKLEESYILQEMEILHEKLVVFGGGAKYGQIVFMSGGAGCFDGDTLVKTTEGHKKISEVTEDDQVYTINEDTGEIEIKPVLKNISYNPSQQTDNLLEITFENGETVICTENHLFYVDGKWVKARDLEAISKKPLGTVDRVVYDLSVEDNHNYMITKSDIVVHNSGKGFASSSFMDSDKFKIRDVDEWKKAYLKLAKLKGTNPEIANLDLKNPKDVFALHLFVKDKGIRDRTLDLLLNDARADRLPNIIFDVTGKDISDFQSAIFSLEDAGYNPKNIHLAWVLTDFKVAYSANLTRDRVVPADVFLDTHQGAAKTMQNLLDKKKMLPGANGRFVVIMNNRDNTIFFETGQKFKGRTVDLKNQKNAGGAGVKGFYYITVKEAGKPFYPEKTWKEELHRQIVDNIPGGADTINTLRQNAIEDLTKDINDPKLSQKKIDKAKGGIGLVQRDIANDAEEKRLKDMKKI